MIQYIIRSYTDIAAILFFRDRLGIHLGFITSAGGFRYTWLWIGLPKYEQIQTKGKAKKK